MVNFRVFRALDDSIFELFPPVPSTDADTNCNRGFSDSFSHVLASFDDLDIFDFVIAVLIDAGIPFLALVGVGSFRNKTIRLNVP